MSEVALVAKGPTPRVKRKRQEYLCELQKPRKQKDKKNGKACAKLKTAQNKKWNKNVSNLSILVDWLFGPLLERGLQQPVVQPQVGRQAEVEDHRLVKQQVGRPEIRAVHHKAA